MFLLFRFFENKVCWVKKKSHDLDCLDLIFFVIQKTREKKPNVWTIEPFQHATGSQGRVLMGIKSTELNKTY